MGDLRGVGQDTGERVFEDIVDGPPIDSRALHRDVGDGVRGQSVAEDEQRGRRGGEGAHVQAMHASMMPRIPCANTNLTCMLLGLRVGELLAEARWP